MYDLGNRQMKSGSSAAYRPQQTNHCPDCAQSHWLVGRLTAECAFCGAALPLMAGSSFGSTVVRLRTVSALAPHPRRNGPAPRRVSRFENAKRSS